MRHRWQLRYAGRPVISRLRSSAVISILSLVFDCLTSKTYHHSVRLTGLPSLYSLTTWLAVG